MTPRARTGTTAPSRGRFVPDRDVHQREQRLPIEHPLRQGWTAGTDPAPWEQAGATWCLTGFGRDPTEAEVREAIDAGP